METLQILDQLRSSHPAPTAGSEAEARGLAAFAAFFASFAADKISARLDQTYAGDVYFNDTLKTVRGRDALRHYLAESAAAVDDCRVQILETTRTEHGEHLVRWTMMIRFKRLKRGQETWTVGMSHLRLDVHGQVIYHQDYWNAADGIFQHIPLLGTAIAAIKRRL